MRHLNARACLYDRLGKKETHQHDLVVILVRIVTAG